MNKQDKLKQEKLKRYQKKFEDLMAEMGEDLLTTDELTKLEKKLRGVFAQSNITYQLSTLKAFDQGARFIIGAMEHDQSLQQTMMLALRTMIKHKEKDLDTIISATAVSEEDAKKETEEDEGPGPTGGNATGDVGTKTKGTGIQKKKNAK